MRVVSRQWSVVSRVFSGDPQGSAFQLRNAELQLLYPNWEFLIPPLV